MSELKPTNHKAELLLDAVAEGHVAEVLAMESVAGCSTTFDPGWDAGKPSAPGDWRDLDSVFPKK